MKGTTKLDQLLRILTQNANKDILNMHKTLHCCLKPFIQLNCPKKKKQPIYWLVTSLPIIDQNPAAVDHCQAELSRDDQVPVIAKDK